jgi:hypothetical protein
MSDLLRFFLISVAAFLVACGGGDGFDFLSGSTNPGQSAPTQSFPFAQAVANFVSTNHNYNISVSGSVGSKAATGSGTFTYIAVIGATFEGQSAFKERIALAAVISAGGTTLPFSAVGDYFFSTNYNPLGSSSPGGADYCVVQGNPSYPHAVKVGDTPIIGTYNCYQDDTKSVATENDIERIAVEADSSTTALVNVITESFTLTNSFVFKTEERYRIDETGIMNLVSITLTDPTTGDVTVFTVQ